MQKKLLSLAFALGVTALASWATPAVATTTVPCHLRTCLARDPNTLCYCIGDHNKIFTCGTFQGSC